MLYTPHQAGVLSVYMNLDENRNLSLKNRIFRIGMIYLLGFTMFFFASLIIITVNVKTREKIKIPMMIGKMYLEEHNNLIGLGLKVELKNVNLVEYPNGYILAQNIAAGQVVKEGVLFVLTVNQSKSIVPVPNIVGVSESIAEKLLMSVAVGKTTYALGTGTKTRIPNERPAGEVLVQYPPAGVPVVPETPVSMLISEGPEKLKTGFLVPDLRNTNIEILKKISYSLKVPVRIKPVQTYDFRRNGFIEKIDYGRNGMFLGPENNGKSAWTLYVNKYDEQGADFYPYEMIWIDLPDMSSKNQFFTVYEKIAEDEAQYGNPAFVVAGSSWPVFYKTEMKVYFWEGYREKDSIFNSEMKKSTSNPNLTKSIRGAEI